MQRLETIGDSGRSKHKTFEGIPKQWHQTIRVKNPETQRVKLYFKCRYPACGSVFKKSCNLRDHFRKHTGLRPFKCPFCQKTFTQSGNLGRHLKNVHGVSRDHVVLSPPHLDEESHIIAPPANSSDEARRRELQSDIDMIERL